MIKVFCSRCAGVLTIPGALIFSPPDDLDRCDKIHLCIHCWTLVRKMIAPLKVTE